MKNLLYYISPRPEETEEYLVTEWMQKGIRGGCVDDCTEVGMERDSACGYGSREHISKVCSQLIIGAPSFPPLTALLPSSAHHWKDEVPKV